MGEMLPNSFYEAIITQIPKLNKVSTNAENYRVISSLTCKNPS
jgi:hypothetical protein